MRQVAVDESCRRQGVHWKMVAYGEELMKGRASPPSFWTPGRWRWTSTSPWGIR